MQSNKNWKLATGLMVLMLLAVPLLAVMPANVSAVTTGNKLSIIAYDENNGIPEVGASVTLIGVHKTNSVTKVTGAGGLVDFTPGSGYYKLVVSKDGFYNYEADEVIRFTDLSPVTMFAPLVKMADQKYALTVQVNGTSGGISGAAVKIKADVGGVVTTISKTTNSTGAAMIQLPNGTYSVVASMTNYVTDVQDVTVSGADLTKMMPLSASVKYSGFVTVAGSPASNVVAYLVRDDPLNMVDKNVIKATVSASFFSFDAFAGNFTLLVDADGALAKVEVVTVNPTNPIRTIPLTVQNIQTEENAFAFGDSDWNIAQLTKTLVLDHDNTVPGLAYAYLPSARMQIDLALGNGDGVVDSTEMDLFVAEMESYGPIDVTTSGMLSVNTKNLISDVSDPVYTITGLEGSVTSTESFEVEMVADYSTMVAVENGNSSYSVVVTALKNEADMSFTYKVAFPALYEREVSSVLPSTSGVTVSGYTEAIVSSGTAQATATLTVRKSVAPTAAAAIVTSVNAYKVMNGSTFLHYIVAAGQNVTFTAAGSSDPNGNPLSYTWDFGDGNGTTVTTVTAVHIYEMAVQYTVNLTVIDQAGLVAYKSFEVKVDGVDPIPVAKQNVTVLDDVLTVDQNKAYTFTSADSEDYLNDTELGIIASYKWVWGDGNTTTVLVGENETVTKTWTSAGHFTMYLNVTDVANHTASHMVNVTVLDTVKPTVKFSVKLNGTVVTSAKEFQNLTFDASASSDASGIASYFWDFGDGTNSTLASPVHSYSEIKTFTVKLTLTDNAGNVANTTYSLKVESSARPDLRVGAVTFDPTKFVEGEDGYIYVNVTNVGTADAKGIYGQLYKVNLDGTRKLLTDVSVLLVNDTEDNELKIGETGQLRFKYAFDSKGDYTLQVNVSANNEVASKMTDNSATKSLTVEEAAWKAWLLYGGIFAVSIVVVVLFLFRKKLPMMSGKKAAPPTKKK